MLVVCIAPPHLRIWDWVRKIFIQGSHNDCPFFMSQNFIETEITSLHRHLQLPIQISVVETAQGFLEFINLKTVF